MVKKSSEVKLCQGDTLDSKVENEKETNQSLLIHADAKNNFKR